MIPLRDRNPSSTTPFVVYGLIAANALVFMVEVSLPDAALRELTATFGMVPKRVTEALHGKASPLEAVIIPAFASMFLHGGWLHLIGNMWFLFIFGDNVEDRLRHVPFLLFFLLCGLLALATQYVLSPVDSTKPTIGASGAIAGVLGAYIITWPKARILTLVPIFYIAGFIELPAFIVLGMWFVIQFFGGVGSIGASFARGGVAYWAHVGGFVAGLGLMKILPKRKGSRWPARPVPGRRTPPRYWR